VIHLFKTETLSVTVFSFPLKIILGTTIVCHSNRDEKVVMVAHRIHISLIKKSSDFDALCDRRKRN